MPALRALYVFGELQLENDGVTAGLPYRYGHLFPGNEAEAAGLLDRYLAKGS